MEFLAEHRFARPEHVSALLGVSADAVAARLRALAQAGYVTRAPVLDGQPPCVLITRRGLAAVGSALRAPKLDLASYWHDVGAAWLWLAARAGAFGPMAEVIGERRLRSHDCSTEGRQAPLAVRAGGVGHGGRERLHYPDLLLLTPAGERVAVELELSSKGRTRREAILLGYAADPRFEAVLYLVDNEPLGRSVSASARKLGLSHMIHVQRLRVAGKPPGRGDARAIERSRARSRAGGPRHDMGIEP